MRQYTSVVDPSINDMQYSTADGQQVQTWFLHVWPCHHVFAFQDRISSDGADLAFQRQHLLRELRAKIALTRA